MTSRLLNLLVFVLIGLGSVSKAQTPPSTSSPKRTLIVLDASGSMWGKIRGQAKIEIAREVIADLVKSLPDEAEIGLIAYGHRAKGDCDDIELLVPVGKLDREAFLKQVNGLMPKGMTPLTAAVEFAAKTLAHTEQAATVILVTDGEETCHRNPCEAARALKATGVDFKAHVIAFDLDSNAAKSVECMATETGGLFLKADDAASLSDALQMTLEAEQTEENSEEKPTGEAALKAPEKVIAGSLFEVEWTGPGEKGDYIGIAPKGANDNVARNYAYTRNGSALKMTALMDEGLAELRYIQARSGKIIGRLPLQIIPAEATLKAQSEVIAGSSVSVEWTGPDNQGDYITIVPKTLEDGKYTKYTHTKTGSPLKVLAPIEAGDCEIRYQTGQGNKVLARIDLKVIEAEVALKAPAEAIAGAHVSIEWSGPDNQGDYITIVPKTLEDGKYTKYTHTKTGSPLKVFAPIEAGDCEIRYQTGQGNKVLARIDLKVIEAEVALKAPAEAIAGAHVSIEWTGPNNQGDYITIVPKTLEDGKYAKYTNTKAGSPLKVFAPIEAGDCEIRYQSGQGNRVLHRIPLKVSPSSEEE
jgi:Ca-activated chloride channel family protein